MMKSIKTKVELLELAEILGNVSEACRLMGYSRDSFYRFKKLYDKGGRRGLVGTDRRKPCPKNRVDEQVENAVLDTALENPGLGPIRAAGVLATHGLFVSASGVRSIWLRHGLETFRKRLKASQTKAAQKSVVVG